MYFLGYGKMMGKLIPEKAGGGDMGSEAPKDSGRAWSSPGPHPDLLGPFWGLSF